MRSSDIETHHVRLVTCRRRPLFLMVLGSAASALTVFLLSTPVSGQPRSTVAPSWPPTDARTPPMTGLGTALGPTRVSTISFPALLRSSQRPICLEAWAHQAQLAVRWSAGQQWALISGTPAHIDEGFDVSIDDYRSTDGRIIYSANRRVTVPAAVCGEVAGVGVIHSFERPRTYDVPGSGLLPEQLSNAYDAAPLVGQGLQGQGETIVLFEADGYSANDLQSFSKLLPAGSQSPVNVDVVGGNPSIASGQSSESTMDIETVHEIAPDAKLVYLNLTSPLFSQGTTAGAFIAAFQLANKQWPGAIWSVSLGDCETDGTQWNSSDLIAMNDAVSAAEANGTSVFAASGDSGGLECTPDDSFGQPPQSSWQGVSVPASLPSVTGVGGTTISTTADGSYAGETTWSEPLLSQGSGGGVSSTFARPAWQTGPGTGGQYDTGNGRQVPDVAADADEVTGTVIVENGQKSDGGGTSLSTPIWAGFTALIDQYLGKHGGHPVGFFNPLLYALADSSPSHPAFHDITIGGNDFYPAGPGYDMVTGLGSPDVWNLARDLAAQGD
jgi:kumamolisin